MLELSEEDVRRVTAERLQEVRVSGFSVPLFSWWMREGFLFWVPGMTGHVTPDPRQM